MSSKRIFENLGPTVEFSDFGEDECGEPEFGQHLVLDFTPDPEIDNDIIQRKVCDFWNFINNSPEIQNLKVQPKKCKKPSKPLVDEIPVKKVASLSNENVVDMTKTACSMLEVVEEKDLIKRAFEVKLDQTVCSLGSFKEEDSIRQKKKAHRSSCIMKTPTLSPLKQLCKTLEQWDENHPKSMDPPGHPPGIQHCIIQRQVFESHNNLI